MSFLPPAWVRGLAGLGLSALAPLAMASPQALPSPLAPANAVPLGYCPPERLAAGAPHVRHVLNVFLPPGAPPAGGWPVVVSTGYGGGSAVPPVAELSSRGASAPLWNLVAAGIAVVHFGTPGIGGGRGMWFPPGHPSGRYESYRPADDNPEKSAEWALQWVKVQTLYPFDLERVGMRGSSGGAVLAIRTAMGPDRARVSGSAQVRASTRVAAILAIQPPTSAWALAQGPELTIPFPKHLEQAARPGVAAATLSQVDPELQKDYSLMRVAFGSPEARAHNAGQALCLVYGDPVLRIGGQVAPLTLDATGFPVVHDAVLQPLQHDSWFGYVFWQSLLGLSSESAAFHRANSVFAIRDTSALAPPLDLHTRTYRGGVQGPNANRIGHDWLAARLGATQPLRHDMTGPRVVPLPDPRSALRGAGTRAGSPEVGVDGRLRWSLACDEPRSPRAWLRVSGAPRVGREPFAPVPLAGRALPGGRAEFVLPFPAASLCGLELQLVGLDPGSRGPWCSACFFVEDFVEEPR